MSKRTAYIMLAAAALMPLLFICIYHALFEAWGGSYDVAVGFSCFLVMLAFVLPAVNHLEKNS